MLSKKNLNIVVGSLAALSVATIAALSFNDNNNLLLASAADQTMTIDAASGVYTSSDILDYSTNYNTDANYAVKTYDGHTFKTAILKSSLCSGDTTAGGTYLVSSKYNTDYGFAFAEIVIGLKNIKSIAITVATGAAVDTVDSVTVSFYDASWNYCEDAGASNILGTETLSPTGKDEDGNSYVPRWASISISKSLTTYTSADFIAISSLALTWNC
jgi:hypothetical protein